MSFIPRPFFTFLLRTVPKNSNENLFTKAKSRRLIYAKWYKIFFVPGEWLEKKWNIFSIELIFVRLFFFVHWWFLLGWINEPNMLKYWNKKRVERATRRKLNSCLDWSRFLVNSSLLLKALTPYTTHHLYNITRNNKLRPVSKQKNDMLKFSSIMGFNKAEMNWQIVYSFILLKLGHPTG